MADKDASLGDIADRAAWPEPNFNDPFEVAAHNEVPEEGEWEYHIRKNANDGKGDAVFNSLRYTPVSTKMPVPEKDDQPLWMWLPKKRK
mmetsp:Transcript_5187/g.15821  ORF Transcript_5187/g.15821 Transcript_5187/m.15821 type:complete len:89 (-) Transcript_5187:87-353(-)